jgi:hypothetical protein
VPPVFELHKDKNGSEPVIFKEFLNGELLFKLNGDGNNSGELDASTFKIQWIDGSPL